jgi:butyryl-CoA dehydrogenase
MALAALRQNATIYVATRQGGLWATAHFYHYELPKIGVWLQVVKATDLIG